MAERQSYSPPLDLSPLTLKQREALDCFASGSSYREIADSLGITVKGVDAYRERILLRLSLILGGDLDFRDIVTGLANSSPVPIAPDRVPPPNIPVTIRQREILELIRQGKTDKEIAGALVISEKTAEGHLRRLFSKFGAKNRRHLRTIYLAWDRNLKAETSSAEA